MEINISWCHLVTQNGVEALAKGCPKLKKFSSKGIILIMAISFYKLKIINFLI